MKKVLILLGVGFMGSFMSCNKEQAGKGQELRINLRKEPISLDPRKGNDMVASQVHFMLFEGLLKLNPDMTLSPAQAKSYEISSDGKTYIFHLEDAKWSNGTAVIAKDFEKSWKSLLDPKFPTPDAYLLYSIKNAKAAKKGEVGLDEVGIFAKDAKTLVVELERPSPHFLQIVASSVLLPVNANADKDPNWATSTKKFVSNGPFVLKEWKFNQEMILEKNPLYLHAEKVKLNRVSIDIVDREMAVLHMYASGYFDLVGTPLSFFPSMLNQDIEKKSLLTFFPAATTKFLAFNSASFPFNNANIRKAFGLAINREAIVEHITQLKQKAALNIIPPALLSKEAGALFQDGDETQARECLEKGLKELKKDELGEIVFLYVSSEINHLLAQELQDRWLRVLGVPVTLEHMEFKTLHERTAKGDFSIGLYAWLADYGDSMNILERFEDKTNNRNYSKWQNEEYKTLLKEALEVSSREAYLAKMEEAERILVEEMPIACLYHDNYAFLIQPHVKGFEVSPLGHIYFERISIDETAFKGD